MTVTVESLQAMAQDIERIKKVLFGYVRKPKDENDRRRAIESVANCLSELMEPMEQDAVESILTTVLQLHIMKNRDKEQNFSLQSMDVAGHG